MRHTVGFAGQAVALDFPTALKPIIDFLFGHVKGESAASAPRETITVKRADNDNWYIVRGGKTVTEHLPRADMANLLMGEVIHSLIEEQQNGLALHASAVCAKGKSIWLPGTSGAGKSSLTAWLLTRGFNYLTDELVQARSRDDFDAFTRPLNIKTAGLPYVDALLGDEDENRDVNRLQSSLSTMIPHTAFGAEQGQKSPSLSLIIFPHHTPDAPLQLEPLTPAQSAMQLMGCYVNARNLENHGFRQLTSLTRGVPAFKLSYSHFNQLDGVLDEVIDIMLSDNSSETAPARWLKVINQQAQHQPLRADKQAPRPVPEASPRGERKKLTIGMATYDDYDGVYFSVQAIRMYHPEVLDDTEILVIDNNPEGPCAEALKGLEKWIKHYRYVPNQHINGTAVRDYVFREANADYVMCIDSHVFIEAGAIAKLIRYLDANPACNDLLQGPLYRDDIGATQTHFKPEWRDGMYGVWGTDERAKDPEGEPFEIPMQGLALFACRKSAWPGFNPAFRGFGGEEGYIHEKFRAAGNRALCLPFLRWLHRFARPMGVPYKLNWEDRIHNYLVGFIEMGLDTEPVEKHFTELLNAEVVNRVKQELAADKTNPFDFFDAIYCINLDRESQRWSQVTKRFKALGILHRIQRFSAVETPENHHIGCALSHRTIIQQAAQRGLQHVLVLEDDVLFHQETLEILTASLKELKGEAWDILYLGGVEWRESSPSAGKNHLVKPKRMTCTHAIAYNARYYDELLGILPKNEADMRCWLKKETAIDQYLSRSGKDAWATSPLCAIQMDHTRVAGAPLLSEFIR